MYINYNDLCPSPLSDFLEYLIAIKGRSDKTVSEYFLDLRTFKVSCDHASNYPPI